MFTNGPLEAGLCSEEGRDHYVAHCLQRSVVPRLLAEGKVRKIEVSRVRFSLWVPRVLVVVRQALRMLWRPLRKVSSVLLELW